MVRNFVDRIYKVFFLGVILSSTIPSFAQLDGKKYLEETSQAFTEVGKKAIPATVYIEAKIKQEIESRYQEDPLSFFNDDFFKRFFGTPAPYRKQEVQPKISQGSGFLVSEDGYILTNHHVIQNAQEITVLLNDGREYSGKIVDSDSRTDVAVVKIEEKGLPFIKLGDSDNLGIGEWVIAIGNPFALEASLTVGVVSAKGRQDLGITSLEDFIQTDAAINPGNSGGPLLNLKGEVVGVNTAIVSRSGGYLGIGFAVPSNMANHILQQILHTGSVKRSYLGIIMQPIDKDLADALSLDKKIEGILISEVIGNSPAEKSGLKNGDIIIGLNKKKVKNISKFQYDIAMLSPNTKISLEVLRNGNTHNLTVSLGVSKEKKDMGVNSQEFLQNLGIDVENLFDQSQDILAKLGYSLKDEGVLITKVQRDSPSAKAGLRPYFLISGVVINWKNQKKIRNIADLKKALQELSDKKYVVLIIKHQNHQRYYTIKSK